MKKVTIILNGEKKIIESNKTIAELISLLNLDVRKIAVEKDLEIVSPNDFAKIILNEGAKIEIVHFIGGG